MIASLRRSFKTRIYKAVLWITILATGGVFSALEFVKLLFGGSTKKYALKINGTGIDQAAFARKVADEQERIRMIRAQYGQYADLVFQMLRIGNSPEAAAVDSIIRQTLLDQVAKNLNLSIGPDTVAEKLNDLTFIQKELSEIVPMYVLEAPGIINTRALRLFLQKNGISQEQFDSLVAQAIKRYQLGQLVSAAGYIPEFEIKREFIKEHSPKKYSIKKVSLASIAQEVRQKPVNDEQLQKYYNGQNSQSKRYILPEKRSATLWTFDPSGFSVNVSDAAIENFYEKNKGKEFVQSPAQVQVRRILLKIEDPANSAALREKAEKLRAELVASPDAFEKKAKELSADSETASKGGLLPAFSKGQREEAFERAAFILKENKEISPVISTTAGFEILQRVDKKPIAYKPLSEAKETIGKKLANQEFGKQFASQTRSLLHEQALTPDKIEAFAKSKHAQRKELKDQAKDESAMGKTLFKLHPGQSSSYQEGDKGVLITVTEIKDAVTPDLASVKKEVLSDYQDEQALLELNRRLENEAHAARTAPLSGAGVESTGWLKKSDTQAVAELDKKGIPSSKLFQLENVGSVATATSQGLGYVMRADEIGTFDQELFDKEKEKIKADLNKQRSAFQMAGFVASLLRSATIEKNESLLHLES